VIWDGPHAALGMAGERFALSFNTSAAIGGRLLKHP
jgi:hypothetical protein